MTLLRSKLAANRRRLKRADRLKALESHGLRASALGIAAQENAIAALRAASSQVELDPVTVSELAQILKSFGSGDLLTLLDWSLEDEPGFVVSRHALAEATAQNPEVFGLDGFIALDGANERAVIVDMDEHRELSCQVVALPAARDNHATD